MLAQLSQHAAGGIPRAVVESGAGRASVTCSYMDLLSSVTKNSRVISGLLAAAPAGLPRHVAYVVHPSIAYAVTELSVWASGAACVPLSVHSPLPELEYFVQDCEAALIITDAASADALRPIAQKFGRPLATIVATSSGGTPSYDIVTEIGSSKEVEAPRSVALDSNALILFTSGTTGKPKGVVHTFKSLTAQYESLSEAWKWSSRDYTLHVLPLHHIHGVQNILNTALFNGAGVEFTPFDAGHCLDRLCSGDVTCFHAVPTVYVKFTQHLQKQDKAGQTKIMQGLRNDSLRYMVSGSAALPVPTMESWAKISGHVLLERYGMTEIGMGLSNKIDSTRYPGCVGWPLPQVEVKCDGDGGILIKGACLFKEYYKRQEATAKEFTSDGWYRTGDSCQIGGSKEELQALQDSARQVEAATGRPSAATTTTPPPELSTVHRIMGRSSVDIIKSGGYKISALEIESVLLQHEKIRECAVVGKPDAMWGEKVTAVCIVDGKLTLAELREWGKSRLATYKVPQELEVVQDLPRNQMGKIEKKKLLERYSKL